MIAKQKQRTLMYVRRSLLNLMTSPCSRYRYPYFSKVCFKPLHFYESPTLEPVFTNWMKSEEDFCFYKKRRKAKIAFRVCFAAACVQAADTEQWEWRHQTPSLGTASQHQAARVLNCVCEHQCFISIYFVHPLARCVLRPLLLQFMPFLLVEVFIGGMLYFGTAGKTCTSI